MGKQDAPPAPDYSQIAQSSEAAAKMQQQTSEEQLAWAKQQYADQSPVTKAYMQSMIDNTDQQTANAEKDRTRYEQTYQPVEDQFVKTAQGWNSADRSNQQAGGAEAEVANQFDAARRSSQSALESYGIDPSQTRFGALDLGTRVQQAAASATAGTMSRQQTEATGLALQGEAINIGKGYPGQVAQSYAGATAAGSAGISAGISGINSGSSSMGNPTSWGQMANQSMNTQIGALNTGYNNQLEGVKANNQASAANFSNIGQLAGGALMAGAMFA